MEDDRDFRRGVPDKHTREIFMANGSYLFCEVTDFMPNNEKIMKCRTPSGREFTAIMGYGTWCERRFWDVEHDAPLSAQDKETTGE